MTGWLIKEDLKDWQVINNFNLLLVALLLEFIGGSRPKFKSHETSFVPLERKTLSKLTIKGRFSGKGKFNVLSVPTHLRATLQCTIGGEEVTILGWRT